MARHKPPKKLPTKQPEEDKAITSSGLTAKQIKMIRGMAAVRMKTEWIAISLGWSKETFERNMKSDTALRDSVEQGRMHASGRVRNHLFGSIFDKTLPPQTRFQYSRFWAQTQEGFKSADRIELTGPDGGPIETAELTGEERKKAITKAIKNMKMTDDE